MHRRFLALGFVIAVASCARSTPVRNADAGGSDASAVDAATDAGAAVDAGGQVVACGAGLACDVADGCCADGPNCGMATCTGAHFACDGPEDCSGTDRCCIEFAGAGIDATGSRCLPSCATGVVRMDACHTAGDCAEGELCCDSLGGPTTLVFGYGVCMPGGCPD